MYGDGAANQGQLYEAANMAGLWKLPIIYVCENNNFAMGTDASRHAHNTKFHKRGDLIPGLKVDGHNVLTVREVTKWAGAFVKKNGPLFLEFDTYRYHGHSMSDPGTSYRTKDEVADVRKTKDCVEQVRSMLLDNGWAQEKELKDLEKQIRKDMEAEVVQIRKDPYPELKELYTEIGTTDGHYIRGVNMETTIHNPEPSVPK